MVDPLFKFRRPRIIADSFWISQKLTHLFLCRVKGPKTDPGNRMDVGIVLNGRRTASEIGTLAKLAEKNGISRLWLSGGSRTKGHFLRLAIAAGHTSRLLLGPVAISPFEMHPGRIGISLPTLDEILNGSACIVLGGGGDFAKTLELPLERPVEAVAETIDIIRQLARVEK
jgi:alkanesulfonate monooxygenase SsuD/methylene tetrahydromethanopterin reductase-like flavin-dependent oxidoreductase (luciferase family)